MRICLIFPKSTFLEDPMVFPPLGLWWLWSILEQEGHDVSFIDMSENNLEPKDVPHGFDVYLVSGTSPQGREIRKLGDEFQRRGSPAILGGPHATNYPRNSRMYYPIVVRREGEQAVLKAISQIENGMPLECLSKGDLLGSRNGDAKAAQKYQRGIIEEPFITDLGTIPIPNRSYARHYRYFLADEKENKHLGTTMFTSRGCPKRCDFCDSPNLWSRVVRNTPMPKLIEEFQQIKDMGFGAIQFYDDILPINPRRVREMCGHLKGFGLFWRCFCRVDIVTKHGGKEYLQFMYDHGLREVLIGAESGSQTILNNIHKETSVEQNAAVLQWCDEIGIRCKLSFIIGLPGENHETLEETRMFLRSHLINANRRVRHKVDLCSYIPMAGTPIYKAVMRQRGDMLEIDEEFDSYGYHPGESVSDFDLQWSVDAALMDNFFYEPEVLDGGSRPDEVFYKGRSGAVRQIVNTSDLSQKELQIARDEMEAEIRAAKISY
jgi:anaerobic magnesium-protoporphyrin IX monomethyl ester cyclase